MQVNLMLVPTLLGAFSLFWLGRFAAQRITSRPAKFVVFAIGIALAMPGLLFVLYYAHFFDDAVWFYTFRALRFTELAAGGLGFAMGLLQGWLEPDTWGESLLLPLALSILVFIPFVKPLLSPLDSAELKSRVQDGVVLQSTPSTCGPASAASILRGLGYPATEKELAKESFTSRSGTENWYLARALRRRGLDVQFRVQRSLADPIPSPAIAGVVLPGGVGHFIAILENNGRQITIADPLDGKHVLETLTVRDRFNFTGFFMTVRSPSRQSE